MSTKTTGTRTAQKPKILQKAKPTPVVAKKKKVGKKKVKVTLRRELKPKPTTYIPKPWLVSMQDIQFWIKAGCCAPSVSTLKHVHEKAIEFKALHGSAFVFWQPNGKFTISTHK